VKVASLAAEHQASRLMLETYHVTKDIFSTPKLLQNGGQEKAHLSKTDIIIYSSFESKERRR
jgi:hypothetical protein